MTMYTCTDQKYFIVAFSGGKDTTYILKMYALRKILHRSILIHIDHSSRYYSSLEAFEMLIKIFLFMGCWFVIKKIKQSCYSRMHVDRLRIIYEYSYIKKIKYIVFGHNYSDMIENFYIRVQNNSYMYGMFSFDGIKKVYIKGFEINIIRPLMIKLKKHQNINTIPIVNDYNNYRYNIRTYYRYYSNNISSIKKLKSIYKLFTMHKLIYCAKKYTIHLKYESIGCLYSYIKTYIQYMRYSHVMLRSVSGYMRGIIVKICEDNTNQISNIELATDVNLCKLIKINSYNYILYVSDIHCIYINTMYVENIELFVTSKKLFLYLNHNNQLYKIKIKSLDCFICLTSSIIVIKNYCVFI